MTIAIAAKWRKPGNKRTAWYGSNDPYGMFVVTSLRSRRLPHVCEKLLIPLLPPPPPLLPLHRNPPQLLHLQVSLDLQPFCLGAHRTTLAILPLASCSILQTFPSRMLQAFLL